MNECILLIDDNPETVQNLALALERPGRTVVTCRDVESAEIALARFDITHIVADVQFSGSFGFEGLHFLERLNARKSKCPIALMSGRVTGDLRAAALASGATALLGKPFDVEDLERTLGIGGITPSGEQGKTVHVDCIDDVLDGELLDAAFQPIVRAKLGGVEIRAFESLTRIRGRWAGGGPAELFTYAEQRSRLNVLNLAALGTALARVSLLPATTLFVNIDPAVITDAGLIKALDAAENGGILPLSRLVLEITERSAFSNHAAAVRAFQDLRVRGIRFALDDHGSAYSHLDLIDAIRPSFIKISQLFGSDFETNGTKSRIVHHIVELAHDFASETILEGVETAATADAALAAGVDLMQGYYFGRPEPASHWSAGLIARA